MIKMYDKSDYAGSKPVEGTVCCMTVKHWNTLNKILWKYDTNNPESKRYIESD